MLKTPSLGKIGTCYIYYKKKISKNYKFIENLKLGFSVFLFLLSILLYGYFVNISSTKGYFVKVENEKLEEVKFQNEIVKIDVRKTEANVSNNIASINLLDNLTGNVIVIKSIEEFVYNK